MAVEDVKGATKKLGFGTKSRLKGFMTGDSNENDATAAPIADLFPHCTVFFAVCYNSFFKNFAFSSRRGQLALLTLICVIS